MSQEIVIGAIVVIVLALGAWAALRGKSSSGGGRGGSQPSEPKITDKR